jgi:hypothetical protein
MSTEFTVDQIPKRRCGNPAWGVAGVTGVSGNPAGGLSRAAKQTRRDRLVAQIAADLAGGIEALSFTDKLLLGKAADLLMSQPKVHVDRTRSLNTAARIIEMVQRHHPKPKQSTRQGSLQEYVTAKYGNVAA